MQYLKKDISRLDSLKHPHLPPDQRPVPTDQAELDELVHVFGEY